MSPPATYALATFLTGVISLLIWLYFTADNPRSVSILGKSLLFFVAPMIFSPEGLIRFPLAMFVWVACEEALKAFASTREELPFNRFWLVSLFGVWELTLSKPFWAIALARTPSEFTRADMAIFVVGTALPALMHVVTAAVYAFRFRKNLWAAFIICFALHAAWNVIAPNLVYSITADLSEAVVLVILLIAALPRKEEDWQHAGDRT